MLDILDPARLAEEYSISLDQVLLKRSYGFRTIAIPRDSCWVVTGQLILLVYSTTSKDTFDNMY